MDRFVCLTCGYSANQSDEAPVGAFCPSCGDRLEHVRQEEGSRNENASSSAGSLLHAEPKRSQPAFTGSAGEYFRIWIVNTFLTILTLGIYGAWAKVRNRQYFYKNILLDGHAFDYTANPVAILKGYLIIGSGIILYYLAKAFKPQYALILMVLFFLLLPLLVYKSLRFFAHNSTYRNIRFRFLGTLGQSYKTYILYPLLIPFTLGLIVPYWAFQKKKYFFNNFAYGTAHNSFSGRSGPFYKAYIVAVLSLFGIFIVSGIAMAIFIPVLSSARSQEQMKWLPIVFGIGLYGLMLVATTVFQQYIFAWATNYCWGCSELGTMRFQGTLETAKLVWIRITNILAIIFSLGLLAPWAKVRQTRYVLGNLTVITEKGFDGFVSAATLDESAYGEAATDFFDLEIGL